MKKISCFLLFAMLFIIGCATWPVPNEQQIKDADYGKVITMEYAKDKVSEYYKKILKDYDSAKIEWNSLDKNWSHSLNEKKSIFGYMLIVSINAKNSFGAYTGFKNDYFFFRNEEFYIGAYGKEDSGFQRKDSKCLLVKRVN